MTRYETTDPGWLNAASFGYNAKRKPKVMTQARRNPLIFVLLTILIDTIGFGVILPVLPRLIMEISQVDVAGATRIGGWLMTTYAGLQFLFGPVMGNLSDRYGRRPVLLVSLCAFGANYALMGLAPNLTWLFIGRALTGISGAAYAPVTAFVADITPQDKRAQSFGLIGGAFGLGFVLGPALGGLLGTFGPRAPFLVAAGLAGINFLYGLFVLPESLPPERRRTFSLARANPLGTLRAFRDDHVVLGLAVAAFFWQLAFFVYPSTWSYYVIAKFHMPTGEIGATLAASGISQALVQGLLTGRLVKRLGEYRAALLGVVWGLGGFLCYAFLTQHWMLYPVLLLGGMQGIASPSITALMSREISAERQGELQGGIASLMGLSSIIGPFALTQVLAHFSEPGAAVFFPGAAFLLAAVFASVCFTLLLRRRAASASAQSAASLDETNSAVS